MHKGELRFVSPERIEHRWFHYVGPKEQGVTQWFLERKAAEEEAGRACARGKEAGSDAGGGEETLNPLPEGTSTFQR